MPRTTFSELPVAEAPTTRTDLTGPARRPPIAQSVSKAPKVRTPRAAPVDPVNAWLLEHLTAGLWLFGTLVVSAAALIASIPRMVRTPEEMSLTAQAWLASVLDGAAPIASDWLSPLGWLLTAGYTQVSSAFTRWDVAVFAAREAMVFFTLLSVVLVWALARRTRLSAPAAAAAAFVFAISPLAVQVHRVVALDTVALPWALLGFLLATTRRHQIAAFVGAGAALSVAMMTSSGFVIALPLVAWLMVRSTHQGSRVRPLMAGGGTITLGLAAFLGLPLLTAGSLPILGGGTLPDAWWQLDPVLVVLGVAASIPGLLIHRLRPWAAFVLALAALLALAAAPALRWDASAALALAIPLAAIVVAGVTDACVAVIRRRADARSAATGVLAFVAAGVALAVPLWTIQLNDSLFNPPRDPLRAAQGWLIDNVDRSRPLVVDDAMRIDLLDAGWDADAVTSYPVTMPTTLPAAWRDVEYVVASAGSAADAGSYVVARFGDRGDAVEIRRVAPDGLGAALAATREASATRLRVGSELATNPRLVLDEDARALLASGRVDERIVVVLGALAAVGQVTVAGFPAVAGESGLPLRQVALTQLQSDALLRDGQQSSTARALVRSLAGDYEPDSVSVDDDSLLLRYSVVPDQPTG